MNLTIDIGNTYTKTALFKNEELVSYVVSEKVMDAIHLANSDEVKNVIISTVGKDISHYYNLIEKKDKILVLSSETQLPFQLNYNSSSTLGVDRIAAVAGGICLFPNENLLVIDLGTCITYDFIDQNAIYQGGAISLGIQMRFKALNQYTARLPLIAEFTEEINLTGKTTQECLTSGVILGLVAEINFQIESYKTLYSNLKVIICGGDAIFLNTKINTDVTVCSELVMIGLNSILQYNNDSNN
jgi:type III pantothenate kinase